MMQLMTVGPYTSGGAFPWMRNRGGRDVAADEIALHLKRGVLNDEAAGGRVDDEIAGARDRSNQPRDQASRLDMWMELAVNLLRPAAGNAVIAPRLRGDWRLLQHEEIIAAAPGALAHAHAQRIPGNEVHDGENVGNSQVIGLTEIKGISPQHAVAAWLQHPRNLAANVVDVGFGHRRQLGATFLPGAFVAEF